MFMKSLTVTVPEYASSMLSAPSRLRIAVPSWRSTGISAHPDMTAEADMLSREEIQALFHGELMGRVKRKSHLTDAEEQQKRLSRRIRRALYPFKSQSFSH